MQGWIHRKGGVRGHVEPKGGRQSTVLCQTMATSHTSHDAARHRHERRRQPRDRRGCSSARPGHHREALEQFVAAQIRIARAFADAPSWTAYQPSRVSASSDLISLYGLKPLYHAFVRPQPAPSVKLEDAAGGRVQVPQGVEALLAEQTSESRSSSAPKAYPRPSLTF